MAEGLGYNDLAPAAIRIQNKTGVPAAVILAVITNEGGIGANASSLETSYNNFFGIKSAGNPPGMNGKVNLPTWEDYGNGPVNVNADFATFPDTETGLNAFVGFLSANSRYRNLVTSTGQAVVTDPHQFAALLQQDGYGTDPQLAFKYQSIIDSPGVRLALAQAGVGEPAPGGGLIGQVGTTISGAAGAVGSTVSGAVGAVQGGVAGIAETIQGAGTGVAGMGTAVSNLIARIMSKGFWWSILFGAVALGLIVGGLVMFFRSVRTVPAT